MRPASLGTGVGDGDVVVAHLFDVTKCPLKCNNNSNNESRLAAEMQKKGCTTGSCNLRNNKKSDLKMKGLIKNTAKSET